MKFFLVFIFVGVLIYSRFIGLSWGLPYPFHPDERNMAVAIQNLSCKPFSDTFHITKCLNPGFFAYGQFPLYVGYFALEAYHFFSGTFGMPIDFSEAVLVLRMISASASVATVIILMKILQAIVPKQNKKNTWFLPLFLFLFSPALIQFSHFGTTESLLIFFYTIVIYLSLLRLHNTLSPGSFILRAAVFCGLAIATKISASIFIAVPILVLFMSCRRKKLLDVFYKAIFFILLVIVIGIVFSPFTVLDFSPFSNAIQYESDVATGRRVVFYTRQFIHTAPILFQFTKIFPYSLGLPVFASFFLGLFFLPWKKEINVFKFAFITYFLSHAFLFAKWTRFMAPVMSIMVVIAALFLIEVSNKMHAFIQKQKAGNIEKSVFSLRMRSLVFGLLYVLYYAFFLASILPGIAYLSLFQILDARFQASEWIYKNIPKNSFILSEAANVVDIPIASSYNSTPALPYRVIPFNFYELDHDEKLQDSLKNYLKQADYIIVPSRRVFMNITCAQPHNLTLKSKHCAWLQKQYPFSNAYYRALFGGELGFQKVAEFHSYPAIRLFGKTVVEFPDENAEETFSVFDHPVIRIYKKI